ncbi:MAG: hypothetical protein ABIH35_02015 [Patescibacteria group bacterium]
MVEKLNILLANAEEFRKAIEKVLDGLEIKSNDWKRDREAIAKILEEAEKILVTQNLTMKIPPPGKREATSKEFFEAANDEKIIVFRMRWKQNPSIKRLMDINANKQEIISTYHQILSAMIERILNKKGLTGFNRESSPFHQIPTPFFINLA